MNKTGLIVRFFLLMPALAILPAFVSFAHAAEESKIDFFKTTRPTYGGDPMTFSWQARGVDSCVAYGGWSGVKGLTGNEKVAAPGDTTTYTLQCSKGGKTVSSSIDILVKPNSVTFDFIRTPKYVLTPVGSSLQMSWYGLPTGHQCSVNANGMLISASGTGSRTFSYDSDGTFRYALDCNGNGISANVSVIEATAYTPRKSRFISLHSLENGDKAGSFQVADTRQLNPKNPHDPYYDRATETNARIDLRGRATLTGRYQYFTDAAADVFERNRVCMDNFDGSSEQQIPRLRGAKKISSTFCFSNTSQAAELLSARPGYSGTATVVVSGYTLIADTVARPDETWLLSVSAKKQLSPVTVKVANPEKPKETKHNGQPIIIYLQPNQRIQIIEAAPKKPVARKAPAKKVVKAASKKMTARKYVPPKRKAAVNPRKAVPTKKPPVGKSKIKKVVPKQSAAAQPKPKKPTAQPKVVLFDAYIN